MDLVVVFLVKINPKPVIVILDKLSVTRNPLFAPPKTSRFLDILVIPIPTPLELIVALVTSPILNSNLLPLLAFNLVLP